MTTLSKTSFLSTPCPLPHLICNNKRALCFCHTTSKYLLGLAPLLYSYVSWTYFTHLRKLSGKTGHMMAHHTATLCPGHVTKQISFQISTLRMFLPYVLLLLGQARHTKCRSHGRSHKTLIISSSLTVSCLLQWLQLRFSGVGGIWVSGIILSHIYCSNFLPMKSFCLQELGLSILLFLINIKIPIGHE